MNVWVHLWIDIFKKMKEFFWLVKKDKVKLAIVDILTSAGEPLETKEVQERVDAQIGSVTRTKLFYRLMTMRGDGALKGKFVGPGKGVWIWWKNEAFK